MNKVEAKALDILERAGTTFAQQFVVILLATGSAGVVTHQAWMKALDISGYAAAVSVLTSLLTIKLVLTGYADLAERVVKTFLQSFTATLTAGAATSFIHADWRASLAAAVPVAMLAALKGLAALTAGGNASLLPTTVRQEAQTVDGTSDYPGTVTTADAPAADPPPATSSIADDALAEANQLFTTSTSTPVDVAPSPDPSAVQATATPIQTGAQA